MQPRWLSFVEAATNIVVGYGLAVLTQIPAPTQMFNYGLGIFGRAIVCYRMGDEFFLYGVTAIGDPRVLPSLGMAREVATSALP